MNNESPTSVQPDPGVSVGAKKARAGKKGKKGRKGLLAHQRAAPWPPRPKSAVSRPVWPTNMDETAEKTPLHVPLASWSMKDTTNPAVDAAERAEDVVQRTDHFVQRTEECLYGQDHALRSSTLR